MLRKNVEICNKRGLHARASAAFVTCARQFDACVTVAHKGMEVPATSVMGLMMLVASRGAHIELCAEGAEAEVALAALEDLIMRKFGEE